MTSQTADGGAERELQTIANTRSCKPVAYLQQSRGRPHCKEVQVPTRENKQQNRRGAKPGEVGTQSDKATTNRLHIPPYEWSIAVPSITFIHCTIKGRGAGTQERGYRKHDDLPSYRRNHPPPPTRCHGSVPQSRRPRRRRRKTRRQPPPPRCSPESACQSCLHSGGKGECE